MISFKASEAAPSFDDFLEMLFAYQGKILNRCDSPKRWAIYLTCKGADQQARQIEQNILGFLIPHCYK